MERVFRHLATRRGVPQGRLRLFLDGLPLSSRDTADSLDMWENDLITVRVLQEGQEEGGNESEEGLLA